MGANIMSNIAPAVVAAASTNIRPPVGEAWLVSDFSSDVAFVAGVPDLEVRMTDGATMGIFLRDPTTDPGKRTRQYKLYLTNALYATITNTGGGNANLGFIAERVNINNVRSGEMTIGATSYGIVQPPVGETWEITEWGTNPFTVAGDFNPACEVGLTDGVLILSRITLPTQARAQNKQPRIIINNDVYLNVYSTPGCEFYYSAIRIPETSISSVTDVVGSANLDILPPIGDEWVITEIGAETWAGAGAPADLPDVIASLRTTVNSEFMENGALLSVRWNTDAIFKIDRTRYLRITENSAGNNEVCISGYLQRSY